MCGLTCVYVCSWHAIIVDGHSVEELCKALSQPRHQPTAIIAKTIKGKGIPGNSRCPPLICKYIAPILVANNTSTFHPVPSLQSSCWLVFEQYTSVLMWFQLQRTSWAGMPKLCPRTWPRWSWRICRAASWTAASTCTHQLPWRTPHQLAWETSGCQVLPATRLGRRFVMRTQAHTSQKHTSKWMDAKKKVFLSLCGRLRHGKHMGWLWPSWAATMNVLWPWMETPTTSPTQKSSRMSTPIALWSATLHSKTWYHQFPHFSLFHKY